MAKFRYVAQVDCIRGNTTNSKNLEFIADENNFKGTSVIKDLNKVALRFVKNQNGGEITGYSKIEIRGYSQREKIETNSNNYNNRTKKLKKSLFSYNIFLIPFVLIGRILKFSFSFLDKFLR
jgi:hypothetical protein